MKKFSGLALAAVLLVPSSAKAVDPTKTIGWCSPVATVCATAKFTLTGAGSGLQMQVYNGWGGTTYAGGTPSYINDIMIYGLPVAGLYTENSARFYDWNGTTQVITAENVAPWAAWDWSASGGFSPLASPNPFGVGGDHGYVGIGTCAGPVDATKKTQTCAASATGPTFGATEDFALFLFTFATPVTATQFQNIQWGAHVQGIPIPGTDLDRSIKCYSGGSANADQNCPGLDDPDTPTQFGVVPEPATMSLLAMGLAGMAAARRRRKQ